MTDDDPQQPPSSGAEPPKRYPVQSLATSGDGEDFIRSWEGSKPDAYGDVAGNPTIGIGHLVTAAERHAGRLDPGQVEDLYQADLRKHITGAPGVYWIGVHVLGTSPEGRLDGIDGRARTFAPLVNKGHDAQVSLVIPLRREVRYADDGTLLRSTEIAQALDTDGLDMSAEDLATCLAVDVEEWKAEIPQIQEWFEKFGDNLPTTLWTELDGLKARLGLS